MRGHTTNSNYPEIGIHSVSLDLCPSTYLVQFGNLTVGENGPGINVVKTEIRFKPEVAEKENEDDGIFRYYSKLLNVQLYPLGGIGDNGMYLAISLDCKIYILSDWISIVGNSFAEGITKLLFGIKGKTLNEETLQWTD